MTAYYNEIDPYAAQWLRNLIAAGHIAPGDVDERSIEDVCPDDLRPYTQCHFFAGIGIWSHSLRRAGWSDDAGIWTASCPCQPFSAAGKRGGTDDERHLWPALFHLVSQLQPAIIIGEQVASKDGLGWFDLVSTDLEGAGYAVGASDLCAAGFGGAHIRQRLYFVGLGDATIAARGGNAGTVFGAEAGKHGPRDAKHGGVIDGYGPSGDDKRLADAVQYGAKPDAGNRDQPQGEIVGNDGRSPGAGVAFGVVQPTGRMAEPASPDDGGGRLYGSRESHGAGIAGASNQLVRYGVADPLDDAASARHVGSVEGPEGNTRDETRLRVPSAGRGVDRDRLEYPHGGQPDGGEQRLLAVDYGRAEGPAICNPGQARSLDNVDWLLCRNPTGDPSWRPVEPGTFPLAHGVTNRMGKLRAYGNGLDAETATGFCKVIREIFTDTKNNA